MQQLKLLISVYNFTHTHTHTHTHIPNSPSTISFKHRSKTRGSVLGRDMHCITHAGHSIAFCCIALCGPVILTFDLIFSDVKRGCQGRQCTRGPGLRAWPRPVVNYSSRVPQVPGAAFYIRIDEQRILTAEIGWLRRLAGVSRRQRKKMMTSD